MRGHAGILFFQLAEEFADGLGFDMNKGRSAGCRTERPPKMYLGQVYVLAAASSALRTRGGDIGT